MGRNQYDITDEDLKGLREYFERRTSLTSEERAVENARAEEAKARERAELKERRRRAREEKARAEAAKQTLQKERIEKANEAFRAAGLEELSTEPIDPHFEMAHSEYSEYLQTPLWRKIRRRVLKRDGGLCQICNAPADEVHHRSYEYDVIVGKNDEGCISLCAKCHKCVEFTPEGEHRSDEQKEAFLVPLLKKL
jgi:hypothetical protein